MIISSASGKDGTSKTAIAASFASYLPQELCQKMFDATDEEVGRDE